MMHVIHGIIKLSCLIGCCGMMGGLAFGDDDAPLTPLKVGILQAQYTLAELEKDMKIMHQSMDTYIPVEDPDDYIFSFVPEELVLKGIETYIPEDGSDFDPFSTTPGLPPKRYDCLFVIADTINENYQIAWLDRQKLHLNEFRKTKLAIANVIHQHCQIAWWDQHKVHIREYRDTKRNIYDERQWSVDLTKEHAEELIGLMKQYKASNVIRQKISDRDHLPLIYRLFGSYAEDQKNEYIFYGVDSHIFGVVFGDGFIPKNTISWYMHSFLQSMFNYFDQPPGDQEDAKMALAYNAFLHEEVRKIQLKIKALASTRQPLPQAGRGDRPEFSGRVLVQPTGDQSKRKQ